MAHLVVAVQTHTRALADVVTEMLAQDEKWGPMRPHPDMLWLTILTEELGEAAKDMLEGRCPRAELVQVAAVAVQWIASIDARQDADS